MSTSIWQTIAVVPATESDAHLSEYGVAFPQVEVTVSDQGERTHVHIATLGPEGDVPEARMTAAEARQLAAALIAAAEAIADAHDAAEAAQ